MSRRSLQQCRAILTGASSGIGRALAVELARRGAQLVLSARRLDRLEQLAAELRADGGLCEVVAGDLVQSQTRNWLVKRAHEQFGGLDLLINNAGVGALGRFDGADPARLRQVFEVNFFAAAELTRLAIPSLQRGHSPLVVNISSILGQHALPRVSEYCASKFALEGLSQSLRAELSTLGIDVLVVRPGTTQSEFHDSMVERRGETPWPQPVGISAEVAARRIVKAVAAGRETITIDLRGWLYCAVARIAPGLLGRYVRRFG